MRKEDIELQELKDSLQDTQPVGAIVNQCKTLDQVSQDKIGFTGQLVWILEERHILPDSLPVLLESFMI